MNTMLVNQTAGLVWWHNMVKAKRMQSTLLVNPLSPVMQSWVFLSPMIVLDSRGNVLIHFGRSLWVFRIHPHRRKCHFRLCLLGQQSDNNRWAFRRRLGPCEAEDEIRRRV